MATKKRKASAIAEKKTKIAIQDCDCFHCGLNPKDTPRNQRTQCHECEKLYRVNSVCLDSSDLECKNCNSWFCASCTNKQDEMPKRLLTTTCCFCEEEFKKRPDCKDCQYLRYAGATVDCNATCYRCQLNYPVFILCKKTCLHQCPCGGNSIVDDDEEDDECVDKDPYYYICENHYKKQSKKVASCINCVSVN